MLVQKADLIRAFNKFEDIGFAGVSALQRELKYPYWKAQLIANKLIFLGIIEPFDCTIIRSQRNMRLQKVLKTKKEALELIENA